MLTNEITQELVEGLQNIFQENLTQIILYGSVARNEETEESDIDIAIVLEKKLDKLTKEHFISWAADIDLKYEKIFSIIDIQKEQLEKWGAILPFYRKVCEEGIILWKVA